ncbi:hypothetical protein Uis1B_1217 [Bifidobacterium margollesii]|uniref:Uncharacterized protein n=1 Tax=Bifidobacterium margollesii TaxID=2020964 RepID=A0A2N5J9N3_9BIFI|nr:hypothetical protein [Bifidobacterium margollesii]PLS30927.1 hypothetical protein Uis1B_1217 [Bifidobacterium margollesii]
MTITPTLADAIERRLKELEAVSPYGPDTLDEAERREGMRIVVALADDETDALEQIDRCLVGGLAQLIMFY